MTTVHTNIPILIQRAGYVKSAKQYIHEKGAYTYIMDGRLYLETSDKDYDITEWNIQSLRVLFTGVMFP